MLKLLIVGLLLLTSCEAGVTSIRPADGGRAKIDCSASYITLGTAGSYTCEQFAKTQASVGDVYNGRTSNSIFQTFNIYGRTNDGTNLSLQLNKMLSNGFYSPSSSLQSAEQRIHDFNNTTKNALNWGPVGRIGTGANVVAFTTGTMKCFGFVQYGGATRGGYDHVMSGYFCATREAQFNQDEMASLINTVIVRDRVSASSQ
jgi:hypothetical protein